MPDSRQAVLSGEIILKIPSGYSMLERFSVSAPGKSLWERRTERNEAPLFFI